MGDRVSRSDVQDPVLHVFERLDDPGTPLSRSEIASELDGRNIDVQSHLDELNRTGRINSKIVDDTRPWWLPPGEYRSEVITGKRVLEHAAEAIFVTDPDGTIDYVNPAFERITGYDREKVLGRTPEILKSGVQDQSYYTELWETIREECTGRVATDADRIVEQSDNLLETIQKQRKVVDVLSERPQHQRLDAVEVIRRVGSEYANLEINIDLSLPERAPVTATSDLTWAVTELVENAIVHNETDRPAVRIEVENGSDTVRIRISDTGPKIPDIDRAVLTGESKVEPLFHGRGMGLWLVYWIVRRSDGSIDVTTNDHEGNTIGIELSRATE